MDSLLTIERKRGLCKSLLLCNSSCHTTSGRTVVHLHREEINKNVCQGRVGHTNKRTQLDGSVLSGEAASISSGDQIESN